MLVGNVDQREARRGFAFDLDVVVPALNNYVYTVLTIEHGATLYPVKVRVERSSELYNLDDEAEFEAVIESILGSQKVQLILSRLLSQAS